LITRRVALAAITALTGAAFAGIAQSTPARQSSRILAWAARVQIGVTTRFDPAYRRISYPNGDVPRSTGVCADVVVRAARDGLGVDLQRLVHEDMTRAFAAYPRKWGLTHPDPNIDHRRVPNLETWLTRHGARLWITPSGRRVSGADFPAPLEPGDLLTWRLGAFHYSHIGIVSRGGAVPMVIQNNGGGTREEPLAIMALEAAYAHFRWDGQV
jgi:uncharacterized protein YijF (DUF1287 family)